MKKLLSLAAALFLATAGNLSAASWNDAFGIGGGTYGSEIIAGSGQTLAVVTSVRSNTLYFITSPNGPGTPVLDKIWFKTDLLASVVDFWAPTNTLTVASNGAAGDTLIWLTGTNSTLATNDLLVYKGGGENNETHLQLVILSGNATDAGGLVATNALGQNQIKIFNGLTNAPAVGDKIYKLARVQQFAPLAFGLLTNKFSFLYGTNTISPCNQWMSLSTTENGPPIGFSGWPGYPAVVTLNFSNAAGLFVNGRYNRR